MSIDETDGADGRSSIIRRVVSWDRAKAAVNLAKHRVDFEEAAAVLDDPLALTVFDAAHSEQQDRWFTLGMVRGQLLAISHTYSEDIAGTAQVRLISARPATRNERRQYENEPR